MTTPLLQRWLTSPEVTTQLRPWLTWLTARHAALGGRTEIRIIRAAPDAGVWSGTYGPQDVDALIESLAPLGPPREHIPSGDHPRSGEANIYFTLNPTKRVTPPVLKRGQRATRDRDIVAGCLVLIDIDPERPSGVSATTDERRGAGEVAKAVATWLTEQGVAPIRASSGNGYHLLLPVEGAGEGAVKTLASDTKALLRYLATRFDRPEARVDTTTYNAGRICKLYGTRAVKGPHTAERPHRRTSVRLPTSVSEVSCADLGAVVPSSPPAPQPHPPESGVEVWKTWRREALAALPLDAVFGPWLTGKVKPGWLECRDFRAQDRSPSAFVADGSQDHERGTFHSFRDPELWLSPFDFLIETGQAADFDEARAKVAALSGVPFPIIARGSARPAAAAREALSSNSTTEAIHAALRPLLASGPIDRARGVEAIAARTGLTLTVLREALAGLARSSSAARTESAPESGRPEIRYVVNRDSVHDLYAGILGALAPFERLFERDGDLVWVHPGRGTTVVHGQNLPGLISGVAELALFQEHDGEAQFLRHDPLPADRARSFVHCLDLRDQLPRLTGYTRTPMVDRHWNYVGVPGFHPESGVYYDGPRLVPSDSTDTLVQALEGFHFDSPVDLVNTVGMMLTALTVVHWPKHAMLVIDGNHRGVGKSTLAQVVGLVIEGHEPTAITYTRHDEEFEKQIATVIDSGNRLVLIDNAKGTVDSPVLERSVTAARLNFRRLGSNDSIRRANDVIFALTMNHPNLSPDLRRRSLPVSLRLDGRVEEARYAIDDISEWVLTRRERILCELAGIVMRWVAAGRPRCEEPARHSTSQLWASSIDAMLRLSGFHGFLENFEAKARSFDPKWDLVCAMARQGWQQSPATAGEWGQRLGKGVLFDLCHDRRGQARSARARGIAIGKLLGPYVGHRIPITDDVVVELVAERPRGATHAAVYRFQRLGAE